MQLTDGIVINKSNKVVYMFRRYVLWLFALGDLLA